MRELVKLPNPLLRQRSQPVKKIDSEIKALASDMVEFMQLRQVESFRPIGLSAPQLGELLRVIAFSRNPMFIEGDDIQVLINPELVYQKGSQLVRESCLSLPGKVFTLQRAKLVKIRGLTLDGVKRSFRGRGLLAQVFQHEIDHLEGLLIDKLDKQQRGAK